MVQRAKALLANLQLAKLKHFSALPKNSTSLKKRGFTKMSRRIFVKMRAIELYLYICMFGVGMSLQILDTLDGETELKENSKAEIAKELLKIYAKK